MRIVKLIVFLILISFTVTCNAANSIIPSDGLAFIGPGGGSVVIKDADSPLNGIKIHFPSGTLPEENSVSVTLVSNVPGLPNGMTAYGPVVDFNCSVTSEFSKGVIGEIPVDKHPAADGYIGVAFYNESRKRWEELPSFYAYEEKKVIFFTDHFSKIGPFWYRIDDATYGNNNSTGFNVSTDSLSYVNNTPPGICKGMVKFAEWFFTQKGPDLKCHYNLARAYSVGNEVQGLTLPIDLWLHYGLDAMNGDDWATYNKLRTSISNGKSESVFMGDPINTQVDDHAVLAYEFVPDPNGNSGFDGVFVCYNPNDNTQGHAIIRADYVPVTGDYGKIHLSNPVYRRFLTSTNFDSQLQSVYSSFPPNGPCYCEDKDNDSYYWPKLPGPSDCASCNTSSTPGVDCDDGNPGINPGVSEVYGDGIDNDCDQVADCDDPDCFSLPDCVCVDCDQDGFGNPGRASCPGGSKTDLDDQDNTIYPGAPEIYGDGIDQDCDGRDDRGNWCNLGGGDIYWICDDCLEAICFHFVPPSQWPPGPVGHCNSCLSGYYHDCYINGILVCEYRDGKHYQCVE